MAFSSKIDFKALTCQLIKRNTSTFINSQHAGSFKDATHGQESACYPKHKHSFAAVARKQLQILYLFSVSGKQGRNTKLILHTSNRDIKKIEGGTALSLASAVWKSGI